MFRGKKSDILAALTFNDAALWGADVFVGVIFALFITNNIDGGNAIHVGLAFGLYRAIRGLTAIPVGRYLDRHKGHVDEFYTLLFAGVLVGGAYVSLAFSHDLWHVYVAMLFIGFGHSLDVSAWRILFYGNIPENAEGEVIGVYETTMQVVYALAIVVAGFVGEIYGFDRAMLFAGGIALSSSLILWLVRRDKKRF